MKQLTKKQQAVLKFIAEFIAAKGFSPTVREIASHFENCVNAINGHLNQLETKGRITRMPGMARTIRVMP